MDADFLAGVVSAALQDELWAGSGRDDRRLLLQLALRAGAGHLGNVICETETTTRAGQTGVRGITLKTKFTITKTEVSGLFGSNGVVETPVQRWHNFIRDIL